MFPSWLRSLVKVSNKNNKSTWRDQAKKSRQRFLYRPLVELFEDRLLPSVINGLAVALVPPSTTPVAGTSFNVMVTTEVNGVPTNCTDTINLNSNVVNSGAALPQQVVFNNQSSFMFNVTLTAAGAQTLTATDLSTAPTVTGSLGITVSPSTFAKLAIIPSTATPAFGTPFNVTVAAQDLYGNNVPSYTASVTLSNNDPTAGTAGGASGPITHSFSSTLTPTGSSVYSETLATQGPITLTAVDSLQPQNANITQVTVVKATPTVSVSDAGGTFTGATFPATPLVAGVNGVFGPTLEGVAPTPTYYYPIAVANSSFESPPLALGNSSTGAINGWTIVSGTAGVENYTSTQFPGLIGPLGMQSAFIGDTGGLVFQAVNANFVSGGIYTFNVVAGIPADVGALTLPSSTISIVDATTSLVVATTTFNDSNFASHGIFNTFTVTLTAGAALAGHQIGIQFSRLAATGAPLVLGQVTLTGVASAAAPSAAGTYGVTATFPGSTDYTAATSPASSFKIGLAVSPAVSVLPVATANVPYSVTLTGLGITPANTFFHLAPGSNSLPSWLSLNPSTGVLSGTPPAGVATSTFTVLARDNSFSATGTQTYSLSVSTNLYVSQHWTLVVPGPNPGQPLVGAFVTSSEFGATPVSAIYGESAFGIITAGPNTGSVPAFSTIQSALNAVVTGDTINVAPGTYAENDTVTVPGIQILGAMNNVVLAGQSAATRYGSGNGTTFTTGANGPKANPALESVLTVPQVNPFAPAPFNNIFLVTADNVTINGFVMDGNNAALTQTGNSVSNNVNIDGEDAILSSSAAGVATRINNLNVSNNIIQNFALAGVFLNDGGSGLSATKGLITGNVISNIGNNGVVPTLPTQAAFGVNLTNSAIADATNNIINVPALSNGIHLQALTAGTLGIMNWTGNTISVSQDAMGIVVNQFTSTNTLNISANTISAPVGVAPGDANGLTWGIAVQTVQGAAAVTLTSNIIGSGAGGTFDRGMDFWNDSSSTAVSVTGGTIASARVGIEVDAVDPFQGSTSTNVNSTVNVTNVGITGATSEGIYADADVLAPNTFGAPSTTVKGSVTLNLSGGSIATSTIGLLVETVSAGTQTAKVPISGNISITGGTTGIRVNGATASISFGGANPPASISGQTGDYITLANGAVPGAGVTGVPVNTLDASQVNFAGFVGNSNPPGAGYSAAALASFYGVENKITDYLDDPTQTLGYVSLFTKQVFVTQQSESQQVVAGAGVVQRAVNVSPATATTINVQAGTYAETVFVNKQVTLLGSQAVPGSASASVRYTPGANSTFATGSNGPKANAAVESVLTVPVVNPFKVPAPFNDIFDVTADNVTISGFVLDGNNAALVQTAPAMPTMSGGINIDGEDGIASYSSTGVATRINNLNVSSDVIQNFALAGIYLNDGGSGASNTKGLITGNVISNIGNNSNVSPGQMAAYNVILFNSAIADVTSNTINVAGLFTGIDLATFSGGVGNTMNWSGNTISVGQDGTGIAVAGFTSNNTLNISANTISAPLGVIPGDASGLTWGISVQGVQGTATVLLTSNSIGSGASGTFDRGLDFWNDSSSSVSVTGGSIANSRVGIEEDAVDPLLGSASVNSTVSVANVSITSPTLVGVTTEGIYVDADQLGAAGAPANTFGVVATAVSNSVALSLSGGSITNSTIGLLVETISAGAQTAQVSISGNASITNGTTGIKVNGPTASISFGGANPPASLSGQTGDYITLASGAMPGVPGIFVSTLDASQVSFGGFVGASNAPAYTAATLASFYAVEGKITDYLADPTLGYVSLRPSQIFVTQQRESPNVGVLQRAVNVSTAPATTINVQAGTYAETVLVNRPVTFLGAQAVPGSFSASVRYAPGANSTFTTGSNGPKANAAVESVLTVPVVSPFKSAPFNDIFLVTADNVTISGFVMDGNNTALVQTAPAVPTVSGGINIDGSDAIASYSTAGVPTRINNLNVSSDIIQNFALAGVYLNDGGSGASNTKSLITGNVISNIGNNGNVSPGQTAAFNVILFNSAIADVTSNTINVAGLFTGIDLSAFSGGVGNTMNWSGNTISVGQDGTGIAVAGFTSNNTLNISANTISAPLGVMPGDTSGLTWGISVQGVQGTATVLLTSNNIGSGAGGTFDRAEDFWNDSATTPVSVSGAIIANARVGIEVDAVDPLLGSASVNSTVNVANVAISGATAEGIFVDADQIGAPGAPANTFGAAPTAVSGSVALNLSGGSITSSAIGLLVETVSAGAQTAQVPISGNVSITGGTTGIKVNGPTASISFGAANPPASLSGQTGDYITLASGAMPGVAIAGVPVNTLDASQVNFAGFVGANNAPVYSAATLTTFYGIENKITDYLDNPTLGYVSLTPKQVFVTQQSETQVVAGVIQRAVNVATATGTTINVQAGTYAETVFVNKQVTLLGAQAVPGSFSASVRYSPGVNSTFTTGSNGPKANAAVESVLTVPVVSPFSAAPFNDIFDVTADNVTISGFVLDGNNAALVQTAPAMPTMSGGINIDGEDGIASYSSTGVATRINNLNVSSDVIQNFALAGIYLNDGGSGASNTKGLITGNVISNIGNNSNVSPGQMAAYNVILFNSAIADVTSNTINVAGLFTGIDLATFSGGVGNTMNWSGNTISVGQDGTGIAVAGFTSNNTLNISANTISAPLGVIPGDASGLTWGISVQGVQGTATVLLTSNSIGSGASGTFDRGLDFWNDSSSSVSVTGGSIANSRVGIEEDAVDPLLGSASVNSTVSVANVSITSPTLVGVTTEGIYVDADQLGAAGAPANTFGVVATAVSNSVALSLSGGSITNSTIGLLVETISAGTQTAQVPISGNASITNGTTGIKVNGPTASISFGGANPPASLSGQTGDYITLASGAMPGVPGTFVSTLDASQVSFGGFVGASNPPVYVFATLASFYAIENKITDYLDDPTLGYISLTPKQVFVTQQSETQVIAGALQRAVNVSTATGTTINVQAGTFAETVLVNKSVTFLGAQSLSGSPTASARYGPGANSTFTTGINGPKANPAVESVLTVPVVNPFSVAPFNDIFLVVADNVTIIGFVMDGNNAALSQTPPVYPTLSGGIKIDGSDAIANYTTAGVATKINNLNVSSDIIQNFALAGIYLNDGSNGTPATKSLIIGNVISNIGNSGTPFQLPVPVATQPAFGVVLFNSAIADVISNTINVAPQFTGISLQVFGSGTNNTMNWSGNTISVAQDGTGIAVAGFTSSNTLNISANTISAPVGVTSGDLNGLTWGISVQQVGGAANALLTNNSIGSGVGGTFDRGMDFWQDSSTNTVSVTSGSIANSRVGIELDSVDPFFGGTTPVVNSTVTVTNVAISGATTDGIFVDAEPLTSTAFLLTGHTNAVNGNVTLNLNGGTISSSTVGVLVETISAGVHTAQAAIAGATITGGTNGVRINGPTASATVGTSKITGAGVGVDIDGSAVLTFDTISGNTIGVKVDVTGTLTSATNNLISGNSGDGIQAVAGATAVGPVNLNSLAGNATGGTGFGLENLSGLIIDASENWWGVNSESAVMALSTPLGSVDYTPWFDTGTNTAVGNGFTGDLTKLDVGIGGAQVVNAGTPAFSFPQTGGRINEAIFDLVTGGTIKVSPGTFNETVTIPKPLTLLSVSGASGINATVINNTVVAAVGTVTVNAGVTGATFGAANTGFAVGPLTTPSAWALVINGSSTKVGGDIFQGGTVGNVRVADASNTISGNTFLSPTSASIPGFNQYRDTLAGRDTGAEISGIFANNLLDRAVTVTNPTTGAVRIIWSNIQAAANAGVGNDFVNILKGTTATYTENVLVTTPVTLDLGGSAVAQVELVGNLAFGVNSGAALQMKVNAPYTLAGTNYDQLIVTGNVDFTNGALFIVGTNGVSAATQRITLISSIGGGTTTPGTNPPPFTLVTLGSNTFVLSYNAGTSGNDVALLFQPTITITGGPFAYDGTAHAATVMVTGVGGAAINGNLTVAYNGAVINPGTYTVTATFTSGDLNYANATATGSVVVLASAVVNHFLFTGLPPSVSAGTPFTFTVTAKDASNNTITGYTGVIHFTSSDGLAVLPGNSYLSNPNSTLSTGTGTFAATLNTSGSQTITVTDVGVGVSTTSSVIVVNPTVNHLVVTASPTSVTAGSAFVLTVKAVDSSGNTVTSDNDTLHFTSSDAQAGLPANAPLVNGVGFFAAILKTAGNQTVTATDTSLSTITGSTVVPVSPAAASKFLVTATVTPNAVTGIPFNFTVTAQDPFGNLVPTYAGTVHFTSSDPLVSSGAGLPSNYTFVPATDQGVHVFTATLATPGAQTITSTDTSNSSITGTLSPLPVTVRGLEVSAVTLTDTGFTATFNKAVNPSTLFLYGTSTQSAANLVLQGPSGPPVRGSVVFNSTNLSMTFVKTDMGSTGAGTIGLLVPGAYTLTIQSGSGGLTDAGGGFLDGAGNGTTANYVLNFTVATSGTANSTTVVIPTTAISVIIPDFARGPDTNSGDAIHVPNGVGFGVPIAITNATGATQVTFNLNYNPSLLNILGAVNSVGTETGNSFTLVSNTGGVASFKWTLGTGPALTASSTLGYLQANVPETLGSNGTQGGLYKSKAVLDLSAITVTGVTGAVTANVDGVFINAYLGDVQGTGVLNSGDASLISRVAVSLDTGFGAYRQLDPVVIGNISFNGSVNSTDATLMNRFTAGLTVTQIPQPPAGVTITPPVGVDPELSLPTNFVAAPGSTVVVPVNIDNADPDGSLGMIDAVLAVKYDPQVFTVSAADVQLGTLPSGSTGWQVRTAIDAKTGEIGIDLFSTTPIQTQDSGSLVTIAFHVRDNAPAGASGVSLVNEVSPQGGRSVYQTMVGDAQGEFLLHPAVTAAGILPGTPGSVTIAAAGTGLDVVAFGPVQTDLALAGGSGFSSANFMANANVTGVTAVAPVGANQLAVHLVEQVFGGQAAGLMGEESVLSQPGPMLSAELSDQGFAASSRWTADDGKVPTGSGLWNDGLALMGLRTGNALDGQSGESRDLQEADLAGLEAFFAREGSKL